jgi:hypothetical protein
VSFYAQQFAALSGSVLGLIYLGLIIDYRTRTAHTTARPARPSFRLVVALLVVFVVVVVLWFVQ